MTDTTKQGEQISPFSNGTQFMDWEESNCCRCTKYTVGLDQWPTCEIQMALVHATLKGGRVSAEIADRMGHTAAQENDGVPYVWPCGEVEWTEEWKAEYRGRNGND